MIILMRKRCCSINADYYVGFFVVVVVGFTREPRVEKNKFLLQVDLFLTKVYLKLNASCKIGYIN